jgi:hypothetical protein
MSSPPTTLADVPTSGRCGLGLDFIVLLLMWMWLECLGMLGIVGMFTLMLRTNTAFVMRETIENAPTIMAYVSLNTINKPFLDAMTSRLEGLY